MGGGNSGHLKHSAGVPGWCVCMKWGRGPSPRIAAFWAGSLPWYWGDLQFTALASDSLIGQFLRTGSSCCLTGRWTRASLGGGWLSCGGGWALAENGPRIRKPGGGKRDRVGCGEQPKAFS